jgi:hypothetical protein
MRSLPVFALLFTACAVESMPEPTPPAAPATPEPQTSDPAPQPTPAQTARWTNQVIPEQAGTFHIVFAFVPTEPSGAPISAVVGLSSGEAADLSDLGPIVRFSPAGTLDVRNGAAFASDTAFAYHTGQTYQIRLDVDLTRRRYTVMAEENGGASTTVATDYAFGAEQAEMAQIDNVARLVESPTGSLQQIAYEVTSTPAL